MSTGKLTLSQITGFSSSLYERYYLYCQPDTDGNITSHKAAEFLKLSGLDSLVLSEIWDLSDSNKKGFLSKYDFHIALKLVALAQNNMDPKLHNLHLLTSAPNMNISSPVLGLSSTSSPTNYWSITLDEQSKYTTVFNSLNPINGKLSGDAVKPVLMNSKLSVSVLGQIWTLSDIDADGSLDNDEFILAMHLIYKSIAGEELPKVLPSGLVPPSKRRPPSVNSIQSLSRAAAPSTSTTLPSSSRVSFRSPPCGWIVGKFEKEQCDNLFFTADKDRDGLVSGTEVKDTFVNSGLSQNELAKIWDLCDINKSGMLNSEQFALAMHLINEQIKSAGSKPIPIALTPEMIPPSLRGKVLNTNNESAIGVTGSTEQLTLASFGIKAESDNVMKEIEDIKKERSQIEHACRQLEADLKSQSFDVTDLQSTLDRTTQTSQMLSTQKAEAQHRLDELTEQRNRTQVLLDETRQKCAEEREELEQLKKQIGSQAASIEEKREELRRLQLELNELMRKETALREQVNQNKNRLTTIDHETKSTEQQIEVAEERNHKLESIRTRLQEVLAAYEAVINDPQNQLPDDSVVDELLATNVNDDDNRSRSALAATAPWTSDDPFMKDDPFSSIADPFGGTDPFAPSVGGIGSAGADPFASQDPFAQDPFSVNGWTNTTSANVASSDNQNIAFSIGNIDDIFGNMHMNCNLPPPPPPTDNDSSAQQNHLELDDDPFGFGMSPFDNLPSSDKSLPPPRPSKAPKSSQSYKAKMSASVANNNSNNAASFQLSTNISEVNQLEWAKLESEKEARAIEAARKQEQEELEMVLKLSRTEYRTQERKKGTSSGAKGKK